MSHQQEQSSEGVKRGRRTSIPCPHCGGRKSYSKGGNGTGARVYRRRQCADCKKRFTSYEISADEYKRVEAVRNLERERQAVRDKRAHHERLAEAFTLVCKHIEEDLAWQKENPVEALRTIIPPPVFEYLNAKARKQNMPLIALLAKEVITAVEIDIDCSREDEISGAEADSWMERIAPFTVLHRD